MRRTLLAAAAAAFALGAFVTAAPAVTEPRCGFQGGWDCEGPPQLNGPLQNAWSHGLTTMPQLCSGGADMQPCSFYVPAVSSDQRSGGGGLGTGFMLLVVVGFIVKFRVWILAVIVAGALIVLAYLLSNRARERRAAQRAHDAAIRGSSRPAARMGARRG